MPHFVESGKTDKRVYFQAASGLSSFTVNRSRNADSFTAMTTPTVSELGSTGVYSVLIDEDTTVGSGDSEPMILLVTAAGMAATLLPIALHTTLPMISVDVGVSASVDALVLTENVSTILTATEIDIGASTDTFTLTTYAVTLAYDVTISASTDALALTEHIADVDYKIEGIFGASSSFYSDQQLQRSNEARIAVLSQPSRSQITAPRGPLLPPPLDVTEVVIVPPIADLPAVTAVVPNNLDSPPPFPPVEAFSEFQGQQPPQSSPLPSRAQEAEIFYGSILGEIGVSAEPNMAAVISEVAVDPAVLVWDPVSHSQWVSDWRGVLDSQRGT